MSEKCECGRPTQGTTICPACSARLRSTIQGLVSILPEVDVTVANLSRLGESAAVSSAFSHPIPVNLHAVEVSDEIKAILRAWADTVYESLPRDLNSLGLALVLYHYKRWPVHPEAAMALDELRFALDSARRLVDRPAEKILVGRCCDRPMYANANKVTVKCSECGTEYGVSERRAAVLDELRDRLATSTEICLGLEGFGIKIPGSTMRSWASRGRLVARGTSPSGRALYRIGDALDLASETTTHRKA